MKIIGLTNEQLEQAMNKANEEYNGNLCWNRAPEATNKRGDSFNLTIRVHDSSGPGAKTGQSGRRTVSANYYAHYEFMLSVFEINPDAKILTAMETYNGFMEFKVKAGAVAYRNVGSIMHPVAYGDM